MTSSRRAATQGSSSLCEVCRIRPKYVDSSGVMHPFCGKTCAGQFTASRTLEAPQKSLGCRSPRCNLPEDPSFPGFCSEKHARRAVSSGIEPGCVKCNSLPQTHGRMCGGCAARSSGEPPSMSDVKQTDTLWREFEREWKSRWKVGSTARIERLFAISYSPRVEASKAKYLQILESQGAVQVLRTFHASQCICDMGMKGTKLCTWSSCGICNILKSAFEYTVFEEVSNTGRHGEGWYSYLDPSKADVHATSCTSSRYRVMIACDVVLPQKPEDSKSVLEGDQVVVREAEAIVPRFAVMYIKPN